MDPEIDRARLLDHYSKALNDIENNIRETKHNEEAPKDKVFEKSESDAGDGNSGLDAQGDQPCTIERSTLKFKAFFFLFKGSKSCIVPFLPVYYQQFGLVASQIGLLQSCSPFTQIPLMMTITCLADRLNLRKTLIIISLIGWILGIGCVSLVPAPRQLRCALALSKLQEYKHDLNGSECPNITTGFNSTTGVVLLKRFETPVRTTRESHESLLQEEQQQPHEYLSTLNATSPAPSTKQPNVSKDIIYAPLKQSLPGSHRTVGTKTPSVHNVIYSPQHFPKELTKNISYKDAVTLTEYKWLYNPTDLHNLFVVFLLLSVFGSVFQGPVHALSNAAVLDSLYVKGNTVDYGYQKAFGPVGAAIGTLAMGAYLSTTERPTVMFGVEVPHTDYRIAFIVFVITMITCLPLAFTFDAPPKRKEETEFSLKILAEIICSAKYGSFLLASAWTGVASGLSTSFLFWYIMSVGGSHVIMGVAGLTALGAETITYFALPQISRFVSHHTLMLSCLLLVVIRFFLYGIFVNPWWLVIPECFKGMSAAIVEYTLGAIFADETLISYSCSLQGSFLLAYYAVGFGMGSILGGVVIDALGAVKSFFVVSLISLILSVLFLIIRSIRYGYDRLQD
ncbi:major facilitator superfamily domain-containing protein 6-like [Asterias rubens]|uniref:major facilitator superfamily domain-containing protein 6-like n=1 Tax=Asterias rubens TaxID=7604 RepID=UPI0014558F86|nr:major facilitator superfamily domain-containing protein 6-like [Asterias rubens]XP_033640093.1 major facilitator superfamily domain-containing protein 6-like [Asterias rubens]XP_033640094.1 major facilitator superfamily domain-containing protein 6-like [Asterias rubens]